MLRVHLRSRRRRAMRPSSLRAGSSIWLRQSSSPPSVPPDTTRDRSTVPAGVLQRQQCAFRIERIDLGGDLRRLRAEHQRLAIADEYVERRIAFGDDGNADLGRQLVDERIALIEQVVGRLAALLDGDGDVAVEPARCPARAW